jgi:hypothetical protein
VPKLLRPSTALLKSPGTIGFTMSALAGACLAPFHAPSLPPKDKTLPARCLTKASTKALFEVPLAAASFSSISMASGDRVTVTMGRWRGLRFVAGVSVVGMC